MPTISPSYEDQDRVLNMAGNFSEFTLPSKHSSIISSASTSRSQLRASNCILIDLLRSIESELVTQRSAMMEVQARISELEQRPCTSYDLRENYSSSPETLDGFDSQGDPSPSSPVWWETRRPLPPASDRPATACEYLQTPRPLSSIMTLWEQKFNTTPNMESSPDMFQLPHLDQTEDDFTSSLTDSINQAQNVQAEFEELPRPPPTEQVLISSLEDSVLGTSDPPQALHEERHPQTKPDKEKEKEEGEEKKANEKEKDGDGALFTPALHKDERIQTGRTLKTKPSFRAFQAVFKNKKTDKGKRFLRETLKLDRR